MGELPGIFKRLLALAQKFSRYCERVARVSLLGLRRASSWVYVVRSTLLVAIVTSILRDRPPAPQN
jgi:hypothetical protein